jgi:SSS family solute:Na+ symporter
MLWPFILLYLFLQLGIAYVVSRGVKSEDDYLVAGRSRPSWLLALSLFATWFGAETCLGSSAAVFEEGLSGSRADPLGYSLCLLLGGLLIAARIWNRKYTTLADFYADRFGHAPERLAVVILCLSSMIWGAAQIRAFGQVIAATTPLNVQLAIFAAFLFVVAYTLMGGLLGDMLTDVLQGGVLIIGLALMLVFVGVDHDIPGLIAAQPAERFSLLSAGEGVWERIDRWMIPVMGSLVAQEIVARMLAAKSGRAARRACYAACGIYLVVGSIPVLLGLVGPLVFPYGGESEQFLIQLAREKLPPVLFVVFTGALLSAILSTIDSILLGVGGLVAHNLVIPGLRMSDERAKLRMNRWVVLAAGAICYLMAVKAESIYALLETASSFGTAGILIITLFGLWLRRGGRLAALWTLAVGLAFTPIAEYGLKLSAPFLATVALCAAVYLGVGEYEARRGAVSVAKTTR